MSGDAFARFCDAMVASGYDIDRLGRARCPAHDGGDRNLHVSRGDKGVLLKCFSHGCTAREIARAVGLEMGDLFEKRSALTKRGTAHETVARYVYVDEQGQELSRVNRVEWYAGGERQKSFNQERYDSSARRFVGGTGAMKGVRRVLYKLPEVLAATARGETIFICEGEKAAESLSDSCGVTATTAPGGAGKWRDEYSESLRGAHVVLLPDNDDQGHRHMQRAARSLAGKAADVRVVELPGIPPKCDAVEWLGAGGDRAALDALVQRAAPGPRVMAVNIRPLSDFEPEPVSWLWYHRIPDGKVTILEGTPDVGKSHLTLAFASVVSTGGTLPDGNVVQKGAVIVVTCEDGIADTVRPRVDAAGGDVNEIHILSGFNPNGDGERLPIIPDDVPAIRVWVERLGARLLIIDPLTAYLGEKVNSYRDTDVRRALAPLQLMAEATGCAVLVVRHLRKGVVGDAISAGGGSTGFTALARCVLLAAKDPDDDSRRVLAWTKNNLAEKQSSLTYRLESDGGEWAHVVWEGTSRYDANALLEAGRPDEERGELHRAIDWLREYVSDGPVAADEATKAARKNGFSDSTTRRARQQLGINWKREGFGRGSRVVWEPPGWSASEAALKHQSNDEYEGESRPKSLNGNVSTYSSTHLASTDNSSPNEGAGDYVADDAARSRTSVVSDGEDGEVLTAEARARWHAERARGAAPGPDLMRRVLGNLR